MKISFFFKKAGFFSKKFVNPLDFFCRILYNTRMEQINRFISVHTDVLQYNTDEWPECFYRLAKRRLLAYNGDMV